MAGKLYAELKVIELGDFIAAPFCGKMLSDMGAEVIKVEEPGKGDESRRHGPFPKDEQHPEKSGLFLYLNANKKGVTLAIEEIQGRKIFKALLKDADVLIIDKPIKIAKKLGLDYASLKNEFPELIVTSITPYGLTGPYKNFKGYALNEGAVGWIHIAAGMMFQEPIDHPMSHSDYWGGLGGVLSTQIALFAREKTKKGQLCDVASFQVAFGFGGMRSYAGGLPGSQSRGFSTPVRFGPSLAPPRTPGMTWPGGRYAVKDGDVWMYTLVGGHVEMFVKDVLGHPEWLDKPEFKCDDPKMLGFVLEQHREDIDKLVEPEMKKRTKQEWWDIFLEKGLPFAPIMTIADLINHQQLKERNDIVEVEHPVVGKQIYPAHPCLLSETPMKVERPAPLLGQHNEEVYCKKLGYARQDLLDLGRAGII